MNLLQETIETLSAHGYSSEQIAFIGSQDNKYCCTWDEFRTIANVEYDDGFGAQEVASDLVIVFRNGAYLHRHEYDGSECWALAQTPRVDYAGERIHKLTVAGTNLIGWVTVAELNPAARPPAPGETDGE